MPSVSLQYAFNGVPAKAGQTQKGPCDAAQKRSNHPCSHPEWPTSIHVGPDSTRAASAQRLIEMYHRQAYHGQAQRAYALQRRQDHSVHMRAQNCPPLVCVVSQSLGHISRRCGCIQVSPGMLHQAQHGVALHEGLPPMLLCSVLMEGLVCNVQRLHHKVAFPISRAWVFQRMSWLRPDGPGRAAPGTGWQCSP